MTWSDCFNSFNFLGVQEKIGYKFKNKNLLRQAFVSPSVTAASEGRIQNYQVLEFIGDSVLGMIVVKKMSDDFCYFDNLGQMISKMNEGKMSELKVDYVKNETLAHCAEALELNQYRERAYEYSSSDYKNKRGDLIEAILGAVALDSNWNYVNQEDFSKDNIIVDSENVVRGKGLFQLIMSKYKTNADS